MEGMVDCSLKYKEYTLYMISLRWCFSSFKKCDAYVIMTIVYIFECKCESLILAG